MVSIILSSKLISVFHEWFQNDSSISVYKIEDGDTKWKFFFLFTRTSTLFGFLCVGSLSQTLVFHSSLRKLKREDTLVKSINKVSTLSPCLDMFLILRYLKVYSINNEVPKWHFGGGLCSYCFCFVFLSILLESHYHVDFLETWKYFFFFPFSSSSSRISGVGKICFICNS